MRGSWWEWLVGMQAVAPAPTHRLSVERTRRSGTREPQAPYANRMRSAASDTAHYNPASRERQSEVPLGGSDCAAGVGGTTGGRIIAPQVDRVNRAIIVVIHVRNGTAGVTGGMAMLANELRKSSHTVVEVGFGANPTDVLKGYFAGRANYPKCVRTVPVTFVGYSNGGARVIELADWAHKEIGSHKNCSTVPLKPRIGLMTFDVVFGEIVGKKLDPPMTAVVEGPKQQMEWGENYYVEESLRQGRALCSVFRPRMASIGIVGCFRLRDSVWHNE